jgi:hypothetical protein
MAVLTIKHYTDIVDGFINGIVDNHKSYYVFIGRSEPWTNAFGENTDSSPPASNTSVFEYELNTYKDIAYGKKIRPQDITYMVPRHDWAANTVYANYDQQDPDLYSKNFFVVNDKGQVYKCIFNNHGATSLVQPELPITTGTFSTSDGYVWKYLYTIDLSANTKFTNVDYIPITANADVKTNAVNGSIDVIRVDTGGINYSTYDSGYLTAYVNNYVVQLQPTSSAQTGFYNGSSIYIKAGFGAGQIRKIRSYNGLTKQIITLQPFDTFAHMELGDIQGIGNIVVGETVTQRFEDLGINYVKGYFNVGDTIVQTETLAAGVVATSNSTILNIVKSTAINFLQNYPIYNVSQSGTLKSGTVTIAANSTYVNAVSSTNFETDYSVGDYIRVGSNANNNIRRITAVNTSVITVDTVFKTSLAANVHYSLPYAANPSSVIIQNANGVVTDTNLNGVQLSISNNSLLGVNYIIGETITMVDSANVSQAANGTVAYSNNSTVVLTDTQGTFVSNLYALGGSSLQKSYIEYVKANPSITIGTPTGAFRAGQKIFVRPTANLNQQVANATLLSVYFTPNEVSEYIISPTVTIDGDGEGALAYSVVNTSANSITAVVVVNTGINYTYANIGFVANSIYGGGATATPIISPVRGHGYDIAKELGARYAGISVTFDTITNEGYKFPGYNEYRKIGIIENPLFTDVTVGLDSFDRIKLTITNKNGDDFANGEIVIQQPNYAAGVVSVYDPDANSTYLELSNVKGTFEFNNANNAIRGLSSNAHANVAVANVATFTILGSNVEIVTERKTNATGRIVLANADTPELIKLSDVSGSFDANDTIYDSQTNAYANVTSIYIANGMTDVTTTFGKVFNQLGRVTLSSHYGVFQQFEYVNQDVSGARGRIVSTYDEVDLIYNTASGTINFGDTITDETSGATGIVTFANSTYLKLTSANGEFFIGDTINNGSDTALVANVFQVLVLDDVSDGIDRFSTSANTIRGELSGAIGLSQISNTISYPDLVKESGTVTYLENVTPFARSNTSKEKISLIIKF